MDDIVLGFDYCVRVLEDLKSLMTQFKDMVHSKTTTIFRDAIVSHLSVLNYTVGEVCSSIRLGQRKANVSWAINCCLNI